MFLRSFAAAAFAAAAVFSAVAPANADEAPARCEAASFRVYFEHNSGSLSNEAREVIEAAARNAAGCGYAELRVAVDASNPYAARRAQALRAAASDMGWDAVRVAPRMLTNVAYAGPDYAEVIMTAEASSASDASLPTQAEAGV